MGRTMGAKRLAAGGLVIGLLAAAAVRAAYAKFQAAQKLALDECQQKAQAARKVYLQELERAVAAAMRSNQLDEATKLTSEKQRIEAEIRDSAPPREAGALVIRKATYGTSSHWADATATVQKAVRGTRLEFKAGTHLTEGKDPAPGVPKCLRIEGQIAGMPFVLTAWDGETKPSALEIMGRRVYP